MARMENERAQIETRFYNRTAPGVGVERPKTNGGVRYLGTHEMSPKEWEKIRGNPRQRNTLDHAKRAGHILSLDPIHARVHAAQLPDGKLFKLDGHTRSYVWEKGLVESPEILYVDIWYAPDMDAVRDLYTKFDSQKAVETTTDQVFGGARDLGLKFESELLRSHRYLAAIRHLDVMKTGKRGYQNKTEIYDLLKDWSRELQILDRCAPSRNKFSGGIVAAALLTFRLYGLDAFEFWDKYQHDRGIKTTEYVDPVQALHEKVLAKKGDVGAGTARQYMLGLALAAYERYRTGKNFARGGTLRALQFDTVRELVEKANEKVKDEQSNH
jgi:hypothetical protein